MDRKKVKSEKLNCHPERNRIDARGSANEFIRFAERRRRKPKGEGYKLPPLAFTPEEALSFLMAEKLVSQQTDDSTYDVFRKGMDKIRAVLRTTEKDMLHNFEKNIRVLHIYDTPPPVPANVLQPILNSILKRKEVIIRYKAGYNNRITSRSIEPLGVLFIYNNWYIIAWCRMRKDYRTFLFTRIQDIRVGMEPFSKEHPELDALVATLYPESYEHHITLKVHRDALRSMGVSKYMQGMFAEKEEGDYLIQQYRCHQLEYFGRWFLAFADMAEIVEPKELKTIVQGLISRIKI